MTTNIGLFKTEDEYPATTALKTFFLRWEPYSDEGKLTISSLEGKLLEVYLIEEIKMNMLSAYSNLGHSTDQITVQLFKYEINPKQNEPKSIELKHRF